MKKFYGKYLDFYDIFFISIINQKIKNKLTTRKYIFSFKISRFFAFYKNIFKIIKNNFFRKINV
ncbi:hypothetical protein BKN14_03220 [Candidatus Gracilibacteria bacterium HOT-871]|nr:hypothetical protein BKN14_03220 [Candidatus Gracilibacteria bacterium HOT-871]RKW22426.1 MAG: hypothetical protein D8B46_05355 [Candidatus Gracilibacteria bacterium]